MRLFRVVLNLTETFHKKVYTFSVPRPRDPQSVPSRNCVEFAAGVAQGLPSNLPQELCEMVVQGESVKPSKFTKVRVINPYIIYNNISCLYRLKRCKCERRECGFSLSYINAT